jgi:hypothetical protein
MLILGEISRNFDFNDRDYQLHQVAFAAKLGHPKCVVAMCGCCEQSIHLPTSTARFLQFSLSSKTVTNPVIAQAISSIPFAVQ